MPGSGDANPPLDSLGVAARWLGACGAAIGLVSLAGWAAGSSRLASVRADFIPMAPSTALSCVALGGSLAAGAWGHARWVRLVGPALAGVAGVGGFVVLAAYLLGWRIAGLGGSGPTEAGMMSPVTAACLLSLAVATAGSTRARGVRRAVTLALAQAAGFAGSVVVVGYAFGTPLLYRGPTMPVALLTGAALVLLSLGVQLRAGPDALPVRLLVGGSVTARLLRAFVPITVGAVLLAAWVPHALDLRSSRNPALVAAGLALLVGLGVASAVVAVSRRLSDELVRARSALRQSDELFRLLVDGVRDYAIVAVDADGTIASWNAGAERIYGYTAGEVVGRRPSLFYTAEELATEGPGGAQAQAARTGRFEGEGLRVRKDGTRFSAHVVITPLEQEAGRMRGFVVVVRDITEQKQTAAKLMQLDRMVAIGTLAAGVGHEINNPLAYIFTNLAFARNELEQTLPGPAPERSPGAGAGADGAEAARGREIVQALKDAEHGASRIGQIVQDLRAFSRGGDETLEPVELTAVLDSCLAMARPELRHRARVIRDYGEAPMVWANAGRLSQVLLNLLVNAAQAMNEDGGADNELRVRVTSEASSGDRVVVIEIGDTGCGIPKEDLERIFLPFFTTKPVGQGTGLGLYVCQSIVRALHGDLTVESEVGRGTTFRVSLPRYVAAGAPPVVHGRVATR